LIKVTWAFQPEMIFGEEDGERAMNCATTNKVSQINRLGKFDNASVRKFSEVELPIAD
jgi:hypothetical protein